MFLFVQVDPIDHGQFIAVAEARDDPGLQGALKFFASFLQGGPFAPGPTAVGNRPEEAAVFHEFTMRVPHRLLKLCHQRTVAFPTGRYAGSVERASPVLLAVSTGRAHRRFGSVKGNPASARFSPPKESSGLLAQTASASSH